MEVMQLLQSILLIILTPYNYLHAYTLVLPSASYIRDESIHLDSIHVNKQVVHSDKKNSAKASTDAQEGT
jgi:hypothetical protein